MLDPLRHPRLLRAVAFLDRVKAYLRRRHLHRGRAEKNLNAFYEAIWQEAAARFGAEVHPLGHGVLEVRRGDFRVRVVGNTTPLDDLVTHCVVRTKPVIARLLAGDGLPVPRFIEFTLENLGKAAAFLEEAGGPCVLKPAAGTGGGLGVVTGIRTRWQLARAAWAVAAHGGGLLLEEQVPGDNYRLLYLDGRLLDVVRRRPPAVVGDGRSNVLALIREVNAARLRQGADLAHVLLTVDQDVQRTLAAQGLKLSGVPRKGAVVPVKTAINENGADDNESAVGQVCQAVVADGARAARLAGVRLAGVDVITRDPGVPLKKSGGVILEVNSPPGYYWHYRKGGGSFPVAVHVLEALLESRQPGGLVVS